MLGEGFTNATKCNGWVSPIPVPGGCLDEERRGHDQSTCLKETEKKI